MLQLITFWVAKTVLLAIVQLKSVSTLPWETAWFEVFIVSEDNVALNAPSFCLVDGVMLGVEFM